MLPLVFQVSIIKWDAWSTAKGNSMNGWVKAALWSIGTFLAVGTVSALWPNPLFARMTPAQGFEIWALALQSLLVGVYVLVRRPACSVKPMGIASVIAFLGVACPTCNKILLLVLGSELILAHIEPLRPHIAAAGLALTAVAVAWEWRKGRRRPAAGLRIQVNVPAARGLKRDS